MKIREVHLKSYLKGAPTPDNFDIVETELPPVGDGEVLVKNSWCSVDPYMRGRMSGIRTYIGPFKEGAVMEGGAVGEVVESKFDGLKPGDKVQSMLGWREGFVAPGAAAQKIDASALPEQAYLGVAGLTGMTAYVGIKRIIDIKEGETMWMSAAAGAVGSVGCQFAKAMGATVIGSAGGADKVGFLKEIGCDEVIDYKAVDNLSAAVREAAPKGVDGYFENVGGAHFTAALDNLNRFGRIAACGMINRYNDTEAQMIPDNLVQIVGKSLKIQGFIVSDHFDMLEGFLSDLTGWMQSGKVQTRETVFDGIENMPAAFIGLFEGKNVGKMLVKL